MANRKIQFFRLAFVYAARLFFRKKDESSSSSSRGTGSSSRAAAARKARRGTSGAGSSAARSAANSVSQSTYNWSELQKASAATYGVTPSGSRHGHLFILLPYKRLKGQFRPAAVLWVVLDAILRYGHLKFFSLDTKSTP